MILFTVQSSIGTYVYIIIIKIKKAKKDITKINNEKINNEKIKKRMNSLENPEYIKNLKKSYLNNSIENAHVTCYFINNKFLFLILSILIKNFKNYV